MTLMEQLSAYIPYNEQEERDRALLLECLRRDPDARRKAVEAGYDIHHSAEILQEFYLRRYAEVTR